MDGHLNICIINNVCKYMIEIVFTNVLPTRCIFHVWCWKKVCQMLKNDDLRCDSLGEDFMKLITRRTPSPWKNISGFKRWYKPEIQAPFPVQAFSFLPVRTSRYTGIHTWYVRIKCPTIFPYLSLKSEISGSNPPIWCTTNPQTHQEPSG